MPLRRRDFLQYSLALAAHSALPSVARAQTTPIYEGIYTDRFTYRIGVDAIDVHLSLLDFSSADVTLTWLDGPTVDDVISVHTVAVDDSQVSFYPAYPVGGVARNGPAFPLRVSLDTTGLSPGLYEVSIDPNQMRPENQQSFTLNNCIPSFHHVARFVVTPAVPGSQGNILWVHDPLTGTAYGGFGEASIYGGCSSTLINTVSHARPGIDRTTNINKWLLRKLRDDDGYQFEFIDVVDFASQPASYAQSYDLVAVVGQFEYLSHDFLANLKAHVDTGGNLLMCANEFGIFRVRLDAAAQQLTTYKYSAVFDDPIIGEQQAGIGMLNEDTIWETELTGSSYWGARYTSGPPLAASMTNLSETGFLFEGTGFVDEIPQLVHNFSAGNSGVMLPNAGFDLIDPARSRTDPDTIVWAATPTPDAVKWWEAPPGSFENSWPIDPDGHALCTLRQTRQGARVIGMPGQGVLQNWFGLAGYKRLFENIFEFVSTPGLPVPSLGPAGRGLLAAGLAGASQRLLRGHGPAQGEAAAPEAPEVAATPLQPDQATPPAGADADSAPASPDEAAAASPRAT